MRRSSFVAGVLFAVGGVALLEAASWLSGGGGSLSALTAYDVSAVGRYRAIRPPVTEHPGVTLSPSSPTANGLYTFRRDVPEVGLRFTVADEHGRLIPDVAPSEIRIFDDQVPVDHIAQFEKMSDLPLRIGLLLDVSDSMKRAMTQEKSVALSFLGRVVRPGTDRGFVMAFGDTIQVFQNPTSQVADLIGAVQRAKGPGESTDFFDAVYSACVDQWKAEETEPVNRVMVVISDGEDNGSRHVLSDVIAAAQRNEIQIYALNLHLRKHNYRGDGVLQRLADETGGRFFIANNAREADRFFSDLEQELRTQYYVSFRPQTERPGYHALQLQVRAPGKLMVHARHGYYALNQ